MYSLTGTKFSFVCKFTIKYQIEIKHFINREEKIHIQTISVSSEAGGNQQIYHMPKYSHFSLQQYHYYTYIYHYHYYYDYYHYSLESTNEFLTSTIIIFYCSIATYIVVSVFLFLYYVILYVSSSSVSFIVQHKQ